MHTSVSETSIAAYRELRDDGKLTAKQQQITDYLHRHNGADFSRLEISRAIDMPINCVSGRVNELLEKVVIEEADQRPCRISGRRINPIRLTQGRLL